VGKGTQVVVAMDGVAAADRVAALLSEAGIGLVRSDRAGEASAVIATGIHHGFVLPALRVAVLGEQEIAGRRRAHRRVTTAGDSSGAGYSDLKPGDFAWCTAATASVALRVWRPGVSATSCATT
jgi:transcription-repair coupling factor (superfamily II helicase)